MPMLRHQSRDERPGNANGSSTVTNRVPMAMSMMVESMVHMVQTARTDTGHHSNGRI